MRLRDLRRRVEDDRDEWRRVTGGDAHAAWKRARNWCRASFLFFVLAGILHFQAAFEASRSAEMLDLTVVRVEEARALLERAEALERYAEQVSRECRPIQRIDATLGDLPVLGAAGGD